MLQKKYTHPIVFCVGLLPRCIAFLILQYKDINCEELLPLKTFISKYYQYSQEMRDEDITDELMTALAGGFILCVVYLYSMVITNYIADKRQDGVDTAVIIVAKRKGTAWTYKNIIKFPLLPMIIHQKYPCMFSAFSLLGMFSYFVCLVSNNSEDLEICVSYVLIL